MKHHTFTFFAFIVLTSSCLPGARTPEGLQYDADADMPHVALERQLDAAWERDMHVLATAPDCGLYLTSEQQGWLHATVILVVHPGIINYYGHSYSGLTWDDWTSEVSYIDGKVPATTHELWHQIMYKATEDLDYRHVNPCWRDVDVDITTAE